MRKPRFNRKEQFVYIKPFKLTQTVTCQPGDPVEGLRLHHMRSLFQRNRIGPIGSAWTQSFLDHGQEIKFQMSPEEQNAQQLSGFSPTEWDALPEETKQTFTTSLGDTPPEPHGMKDMPSALFELVESQKEPESPIRHVGAGWYEVEVNEQIHKVRGEEAAKELLERESDGG